MSSELILALLSVYGSFADKRVRNPESGAPIRIDDWTPVDNSQVFCHMQLMVTDRDTMRLTMSQLPSDTHVFDFLSKLNAKITEFDNGIRVELVITVSSSRKLERLAKLVRQVTGRGRRYTNPNWKWISPRAANAIVRLAQHLRTIEASRQLQQS